MAIPIDAIRQERIAQTLALVEVIPHDLDLTVLRLRYAAEYAGSTQVLSPIVLPVVMREQLVLAYRERATPPQVLLLASGDYSLAMPLSWRWSRVPSDPLPPHDEAILLRGILGKDEPNVARFEAALRDAQEAYVDQNYAALGEAIYSAGDFYDETTAAGSSEEPGG